MAMPEVAPPVWRIVEKPSQIESRFTSALSYGYSLHEALLRHVTGSAVSAKDLQQLGIEPAQFNLPFINGAFDVATWMAEVVAARTVERRLPEVTPPPLLQERENRFYLDVLRSGIEESALQADVRTIRRSLRSDPTGYQWVRGRFDSYAESGGIHPAEIQGADHGIRRLARIRP